MKRVLLITIIVIGITISASAQDPGIPDTVRVESVYITPPVNEITVEIYLFSDNFDSVAYYNTPYTFPSTSEGINFDRVEYYPPVSEWDDTYYEYFEDEGFLRMFGFMDIDSTPPPPPP